MSRSTQVGWAVFLSISLCVAVGSVAWANANVDRSEEIITFDDLLMFNPCAGEMMELTGEFHVRTQTVIRPNGGMTVTVHQRLSAEGVGVDSGDRYIVRDRSSDTETINANNDQTTLTFHANARMISPGPGDNAFVKRTLVVIVDANGETRVDRDPGLSIECR